LKEKIGGRAGAQTDNHPGPQVRDASLSDTLFGAHEK
jgi:hypothetical protein